MWATKKGNVTTFPLGPGRVRGVNGFRPATGLMACLTASLPEGPYMALLATGKQAASFLSRSACAANLSAASSCARVARRIRSRPGSAHFLVTVFIACPVGQCGRARLSIRSLRWNGCTQVVFDPLIGRLTAGRLQDIARQRQIQGAPLRCLCIGRVLPGPTWQRQGQEGGQ